MKAMFLQQSYLDNQEDYEKSLTRHKFPKWDYLILTASNENQAQAYREQLRFRLENGYLPKETHYAVLPDPEGKRVGSGGATLNALQYIRMQEGTADCFIGKRILVIHSGGDSKRVPQYSACGKLFAPVPHELPDGRRSTLFDEFIIGMSGIPSRIQDGMLVLSGDVLLLFNPMQIDFGGRGAACISFKEPAEIGENHGVFLSDENGYVKEFLHKQSVEQLRKKGAVNASGNVNIDTGAILFSGEMLNDLYCLISTDGDPDGDKFARFVNEQTCLSFYADFLYPLAADATPENYYHETPEGGFTEELKRARTALWDILHKYRMKLFSLSPAEFLHFGTTRELLSFVTDRVDDYQHLGWRKNVKSLVNGQKCSANNSYLQGGVTVGADSYIEDSCIVNGTTVGNHCIVSMATLDGVHVPDNTVLHCLKTKDGTFVCRIYGVNDSPKEILAAGTLLGEPIADFLQSSGISASELWHDGEPQSLWHARLYAPMKDPKAAVDFALNLDRIVQGNGDVQAFLDAERISLCESFNHAEVTEILSWSAKVTDRISAQRLLGAIDSRVPLAELEGTAVNHRTLADILHEAEESGFSRKIRIYYYLSRLAPDHAEQLEDACFSEIRDAIFDSTKHTIREREDLRIAEQEVIVRLPVRVNFGGGWSDTPPYCNEHGGTVLNAAITLNGELPIVAAIRRLHEPIIAFESRDSDAYREFHDMGELQNCSDPSDAFALHKAALMAFGLIPRTGNAELSEILRRIGGGFCLSTEVIGIPRGSGLGTSSILAGAAMKALYRFFGQDCVQNDLYGAVLVMEQLMSTGGGWQDQVGGLTTGIKLITTKPGLVQNVKCQAVDISAETLQELQDRFIIIYTGQRRLARNLLHEVVGRYIAARPQSLEALSRIQKFAVLMRFELERNDVDAFAALMNRHWEMSKQLDMGCTNTCIDQIFLSIEEMLAGKMICGAGGGGFLQAVLKKGFTVQDVRGRLQEIFQDSGVDVWECRFI